MKHAKKLALFLSITTLFINIHAFAMSGKDEKEETPSPTLTPNNKHSKKNTDTNKDHKIPLMKTIRKPPLRGVEKIKEVTQKTEVPLMENPDLIVKKVKSTKVNYFQEIDFDQSEPENPFEWQIGQHYNKLALEIEKISAEHLISTVKKIIITIEARSEFFIRHYKALLHTLKERIYNWMNEDVLTFSNFSEEQIPSSSSSISSGNKSESDEDSWRVNFMEGFNRNHEDDNSENDSENENTNISSSEVNEDISEDEEDISERFSQWKVQKLNQMLDINVKRPDEFTQEIIDVSHIRKFLKEHVEGGYSWLINEDIEGVYETSKDFSSEFKKEIGVPAKLLDSIFEGLWFDYDWEKTDIGDSGFIQKTYIQTLTSFIEGAISPNLKKYIEGTLQQLLLYNPNDFNTPFNKLIQDYNSFAKHRDWRNALITWSVYSSYRKIFKNELEDKLLEKYDTAVNVVNTFNKKNYLLNNLQKSIERARQYYTKVYPHHDTSHVIFSAKNKEKTAILNLKPTLKKLKYIGQQIEEFRPGNENILIPAFYLVISDRPHKKGGGHKRIFVPIEFNLKFPHSILTKDSGDGVFPKEKPGVDYFRQQAEKDFLSGKDALGFSKELAEEAFKKAKPQELHHSERVWIELMKKEIAIDNIVKSLINKMYETFPDGYVGEIKIYSVLGLFYSTNTVCPFCTPALVALQNSHDGGFLAKLSQRLNTNSAPGFLFKTRGYNKTNQSQDPGKFRLNTIVTATTNFDPEAHDLTESGQHTHTSVNKAPKTHNPHAKLNFPNNAIDLHKEPLTDEEQTDPIQRFFYEFVGKDLHTEKKPDGLLPYKGLIFSSGGKSWKVPEKILKHTH